MGFTFTNDRGRTITFTENYVELKSNPEVTFFPYDKIEKLKVGSFLMSYLDIKGDGKEKSFFVPAEDKMRLKELVKCVKMSSVSITKDETFINNANTMVVFSKDGIRHFSSMPEECRYEYTDIQDIVFLSNTIDITFKNTESLLYVGKDSDSAQMKGAVAWAVDQMLQQETRMKCTVCGHVFCYTGKDIRRNQEYAKEAKRSANFAVTQALVGTQIGAYHGIDQSERALDKIIDYSKCPKCNSRELINITGEDDNTTQSCVNQSNNTSFADELKKYKELLDSGVITQEEFDAKKKQLLGL